MPIKVTRAEGLRVIAAWFDVEADIDDAELVRTEVRRMVDEGVSEYLRTIAGQLERLDGPA